MSKKNKVLKIPGRIPGPREMLCPIIYTHVKDKEGKVKRVPVKCRYPHVTKSMRLLGIKKRRDICFYCLIERMSNVLDGFVAWVKARELTVV